MYRRAVALIRGLWALGLVGCLIVGAQSVRGQQPSMLADRPSTMKTAEDATPEPGFTESDDVSLQNPVSETPASTDSGGTMTARVYGPKGTYITLDEYYRQHPEARTASYAPRPRWQYKPPTARITQAQIAWAKMLPNYDGLKMRGLTDEQVIQNLAPREVKALEGDTVPEYLRPDLAPQLVHINERCADGTCTTGFCPKSRAYLECKGGVCRLRRR